MYEISLPPVVNRQDGIIKASLFYQLPWNSTVVQRLIMGNCPLAMFCNSLIRKLTLCNFVHKSESKNILTPELDTQN